MQSHLNAGHSNHLTAKPLCAPFAPQMPRIRLPVHPLCPKISMRAKLHFCFKRSPQSLFRILRHLSMNRMPLWKMAGNGTAQQRYIQLYLDMTRMYVNPEHRKAKHCIAFELSMQSTPDRSLGTQRILAPNSSVTTPCHTHARLLDCCSGV